MEKTDPNLLAHQIEELQHQVLALEDVVAWLLFQLQKTPHFQPDLINRFLVRQAHELNTL